MQLGNKLYLDTLACMDIRITDNMLKTALRAFHSCGASIEFANKIYILATEFYAAIVERKEPIVASADSVQNAISKWPVSDTLCASLGCWHRWQSNGKAMAKRTSSIAFVLPELLSH